MKIKTSELSGAALDWAVAKIVGRGYPYPAATDWSVGGPIIERERIELKYLGYDRPPYWGALKFSPGSYSRIGQIGPTPLIAAMRCYVAYRLGDEIDIPEELLK